MKSLISFFSRLTAGKKLLLLFAPILTVIASMGQAIIGLCILIFIDLITGIRKNHIKAGISCSLTKKEYWKEIKSYLLRQTWKKSYEYGLGIIVIVVFETLIFGTYSISVDDKVFTISELLVVIPAIVEVWSIFENLEEVSGNNILKKIKFLLPPVLSNLFKKDERSNNS